MRLSRLVEVISIALVLSTPGFGQPQGLTAASTTAPSSVVKAPSRSLALPLILPDKDAKELVDLSAQIEGMAPQMPNATAQAEQAAKALNQANLFIANYNRLLAEREAIRLRAAADVCGCKSAEVELTPDGKNVVHK